MFRRIFFGANFFLFLLFFLVTFGMAAEVQNVRPSKVGNRILFEFDVVGEEPETEVTVTVRVGDNTLSSDQLHLEGDFEKVRPGSGKKVYWNVLQDFPRGLSEDIRWAIVAGGRIYEGRIYKDPVTGMELVFVKGGCYEMGDTFGDGDEEERPVHVCVRNFYIGKYEVTQGQWQAVMGSNPSKFNCGDDCPAQMFSWWPVESISWDEAQEFISRLNQKTGKKFRLPTEAEWEYAARSGGKREKWAGTSNESELGDYAWYEKNSGRTTHSVGQKKPNGLGLYDMTGNVWEWCQDCYDEDYGAPKIIRADPCNGNIRVLRGGSWHSDARGAWASNSLASKPPFVYGGDSGFRLVLAPR